MSAEKGLIKDMKDIKIGVIGLGARGTMLLRDVILPLKAGEVTAVLMCILTVQSKVEMRL